MVHGETVAHWLYAMLFGGGGGILHNLLRVRGGNNFHAGWLMFDFCAAVLGAWAFNISFADDYGQYLAVIDLGIGLSILALLATFEKIFIKRIETLMKKHDL